MYIVVEKLKDKDIEYDFDMRLKAFEQVEDAIMWAVTAPLRCGMPFDYYEVYEINVYKLGEKIL